MSFRPDPVCHAAPRFRRWISSAGSAFLLSMGCGNSGSTNPGTKPDASLGDASLVDARDAPPDSDAGIPGPDVAADPAPNLGCNPDAEVGAEVGPEPPSAPLERPSCDAIPKVDILADLSASSLAVDRESLYLADNASVICGSGGGPCFQGPGGALRRFDLASGAIETLVEGPSTGAGIVFGWITAGGGKVYWENGELFRLDSGSGAYEAIPMTADCAQHLQANTTHLYYLDSCEGGLWRLAHGSCTVERVAAGAPSTTVAAYDGKPITRKVAVGTDHVYWAEPNGVHRALHAGGDEALVYENALETVALAVDDTAVYALLSLSTEMVPNRLVRVPFDGTAPEELTSLAGPQLFADGQYVYFVENNPNDGLFYVRRRSELFGDETVTYGRLSLPYGDWWPLIARRDRLYWTQSQHLLFTTVSEAPPVVSPLPLASTAWEQTYGDVAVDEFARFAAMTPSGDLIVAGTIENGAGDVGGRIISPQSGSSLVGFVARYSGATGEHVWSVEHGELPTCLAVDANGEILVVDEKGPGSTASRLSPDGRVLAERPVPDIGPFTQYYQRAPHQAELCGFDALNNAYLARILWEPEMTLNTYLGVLKIDPTGADVWDVRLGVSGDGSALLWDAAFNVQGDAFLAASLTGAVDFGGIVLDATSVLGDDTLSRAATALVRLRSDGSLAYAKLLRGLSPNSVAATADGGTVFHGNGQAFVDVGRGTEPVANPGKENHCLVKYTAMGDVEWMRCFVGVGLHAFGGVTVGQDGHLFLTGGGLPSDAHLLEAGCWGGRIDADSTFVAQMDSNGTLLDVRTLPVHLESAINLVTDAQGGVFITLNGLGGSTGSTAAEAYLRFFKLAN